MGKDSGVHSILQLPFVCSLFQKIVGGDAYRASLAERFLQNLKNKKE